MWTKHDIKFMQRALSLAEQARGCSTPDPMVGAVLVKNNRVLAEGFHSEVATPHAEAWAIEKAGQRAKGSTLYITLEPCCHHGNNPPCVENIVTSEVSEVVVAMRDPNPLVNGKGFSFLKKHGVKVRIGLLREKAERLNEVFITYITKQRPFVVLKSALTLDGKIATYSWSRHLRCSPRFWRPMDG